MAIKNPELVGEVFSSSTKRFDESDKLECYKTIPTLKHVLFVDPALRRRTRPHRGA